MFSQVDGRMEKSIKMTNMSAYQADTNKYRNN